MASSIDPKRSNDPLSHDELLTFSQQVAAISGAGLPLGPGLRATAEELPRGTLRSTFEDLAESIDQGKSVDHALKEADGRFPKYLVGIVAAGVHTGDLSRVLGQFVKFTNIGQEVRRTLWVNLLYPLTAVFLAAAIMIFSVSWLVSSFSTLFRDFGVKLPGLTIVIIRFSEFLVHQGSPLIALTLLALVAYLGSKLFLSVPTRRGLATHLPILGRIWETTAVAEFCHLLALLLECKIPLVNALELTAAGVQNSELERVCLLVKAEVEKGRLFSDSVREIRSFPMGLSRILRWSEGHDGLAESLHMTGDILEARAAVQARVAGTFFSLLALFLIIMGVVFVMTSLYLPMIRLISALSG